MDNESTYTFQDKDDNNFKVTVYYLINSSDGTVTVVSDNDTPYYFEISENSEDDQDNINLNISGDKGDAVVLNAYKLHSWSQPDNQVDQINLDAENEKIRKQIAFEVADLFK